MTAAVRPLGDRAFAIDAGAIAIISVAIVAAADQLAFMTQLVPGIIALRLALWSTLPVRERGPLGAELLLLAGCTLVGGFNDWSSVVRHRIYDYGVPVYFPELSTIPIWMLLYWGLILRFLATLFRWRRFDPAPRARDEVYLPGGPRKSARLRVVLLLTVVLVTRQLIYRLYDHPIGSWLPFAVGLVLYAALLRPGRRELRFAALFAVGGPLVEIAYIQGGGLHSYHLGWLGGVPLWIALWWVLSALIWRDLSLRLAAAWPRGPGTTDAISRSDDPEVEHDARSRPGHGPLDSAGQRSDRHRRP